MDFCKTEKEKRKRGVKMAKPNNTEAKVLPILEPIIAEKGLEIWNL